MPKARKPSQVAGFGAPDKTNRRVPKGRSDLRAAGVSRMIKLRKEKVRFNSKGELVRGNVIPLKDQIEKGKMAHIQPDRRWFGNTKVIGQKLLQEFREEMGKKHHDPYSVILNARKLPLSLLTEPAHNNNATPKKMLEWGKTFGKKSTRKKAEMRHASVSQLAETADEKTQQYIDVGAQKDKQTNQAREQAAMEDKDYGGHEMLKAGQSSRIWNELYKVIDSSDVVLQILDARDPMGTRCSAVEKYLRKEKKYKSLVFVLNKIDLVPEWSHRRWTAILSKEFPTIPFQSSITNPQGKGNLISLVRQYSKLFKQNKNSQFVSVGLIGYPNVGKSSVINTLRGKKVCNVAPIPGETKVWQYVALSKKVYLIDCPGVIHHTENNNPTETVLKGVVRVERLGNEDKSPHVQAVLEMIEKRKIALTYGLTEDWEDVHEFLTMLAEKRGKLLIGGIPDVDTAARMVLYDWQRAKLPWFKAPPHDPDLPLPEAPESDDEKDDKTKDATTTTKNNNAESKKRKQPLSNTDKKETENEEEEAVMKKRKVVVKRTVKVVRKAS